VVRKKGACWSSIESGEEAEAEVEKGDKGAGEDSPKEGGRDGEVGEKPVS
jgi:hypothetical protein